jgi:asparagine synthase (glutamine-hydrolysing)
LDGRLDNREELIRELKETKALTSEATDLDIIVAAYATWGTKCFAKLIGDWALSIWEPVRRSLLLAKDPIGTRHLYYSFAQKQITWSTILDPLVLLAGKLFTLEEEYIAGWLSFFPATHLTPYVGIHSVPPSCFVRLDAGQRKVAKYWDFDPDKRIRYRTDNEYEEHFRQVFAESVRRRLRSDSAVLAELSGGMDSSSIVCVADTIITHGAVETPRLDTLSYYDDSEPNWNERPYFTKVEGKRGRAGWRIDVSKQELFKFDLESNHFASTPSSGNRRPREIGQQFSACMSSNGNRVLLSGVGGDEVMGGVPTPSPELEDLLARARFRTLAHQLKVWALNRRKPWLHLFLETARGFFPPALIGIPKHRRPANWLDPGFVKRNRSALQGYETRLTLFGALPSFQESISALQTLRRQLACDALSPDLLYEKRYSFLDRELLEFLYAVPREQLVRPGRRRSLMRRALAGTVPDEILNRKRKAFVVRAPMTSVSTEWANLTQMTQHMVSAAFGILDPKRFTEAFEKARYGQTASLVALTRTIGLEASNTSRLGGMPWKVWWPSSQARSQAAFRLWVLESIASSRSRLGRFCCGGCRLMQTCTVAKEMRGGL